MATRDFIKDPLRVITTFSGYDSQAMALERIKQNFDNFDYDLVRWCEIDQNAIKAHDLCFPQFAGRNLGDITQVDWAKLKEEVGEIDLFTYSSPCFVAGTLILTQEGYKRIETIKVGDLVLTHNNRFCPVEKIGSKPSSDIYELNGSMFDTIVCTGEHPFYTRERYRYGHKSERRFKQPQWTAAKDLNRNTYLGYAINTKSELPQWNGTIDNRWGHHKHVNNLQPLFDKPAFWYVMGRYVGDGWKKIGKSGNGIIICCSDRNEEILVSAFNELGWNAYKATERTVYKYTVCSNELCSFVERYGYMAYGKRIDPETMNLPVEMLKSFIAGVMDSDGCFTNNEYKVTTVSRELAYGLQQCIVKAYRRPVKMYRMLRPSTCVIEDRVVKQRDTYTIVFHLDDRKQDCAFYEDGYVWFPLKSVIKTNTADRVYNIQVADDHTYTANGAIVHNCQDFSNAGLQRGGEKGSGTRSSLLWECEKAISILRPKYTMLENVKALVSKKFFPLFLRWEDILSDYGYKSFYKVLNAKDYGVPQNRERVFLISIREDVFTKPYVFPKPFPLERKLKDVLEENVDDKYYLSEKSISGFLAHNENHEEKGTGFV